MEQEPNARSIRLPPEPHSVAQGRHFVHDFVGDRIDDPAQLLLMTGELVTNVVVHAHTVAVLAVTVSARVIRVEVHDEQASTDAFRDRIARPAAALPQSAAASRGIGIVHALARRMGCVDDPDGGKTVWFECDRRQNHRTAAADGESVAPSG